MSVSDVGGRTGQDQVDQDVLAYIASALAELRFGALEITVHEGRIVQIERREKHRFDAGRTQQHSNRKK